MTVYEVSGDYGAALVAADNPDRAEEIARVTARFLTFKRHVAVWALPQRGLDDQPLHPDPVSVEPSHEGIIYEWSE